ncbi:hypothetical protein FRB95_009447 [Tulasnella sp. JGI-2019a]|nr:hypothetical protein FRB95_009447 [Tulasnella sp. JGI-2019a]
MPIATVYTSSGALSMEGPAANGAVSMASKDKSDILIDCSNCQRPIASNRYAPHLSSCLGLSNGTRRGAARGAVGKPKLVNEGSRSNSPQIAVQEDGQHTPTPPRKGRPPKNTTPKKPKPKGTSDVDRITSPLQNQRPTSPSPSPSLKGLPSASTTHTNYPKIPSGLRASSTTSAAGPLASHLSPSPHAAGAEVEEGESAYSPSQSPTRSSSPESDGRRITHTGPPVTGVATAKTGSKSVPGKTAPPSYENIRTTAPITITRHNDPDYVGVDGDDLVDTESSDDGDGEQD